MTRHFPRPHRHHGLPRWQRLVLYVTGGALLASGAGWLAVHYLVGAGAGELPHPLEPWAMKLHGLAGFAALFMIGVLAGAHIPQGWRMSGRHRWAPQRDTGLALTIAAALLALTGYLLYYFAPEAQRPALGWIHSGIGLVMAAALLVHRRPKARHPRD
jgi:hypothetical protein